MQSNTLLTSQETIAQLQNEILKLKLIKHQLEQKLANNLDETKRDLVADLLTQNEELRKQIEETEEKREFKDAACQTNLDRLNIDQLIEASLTLKRQKRQVEQTEQRHDTFNRHQHYIQTPHHEHENHNYNSQQNQQATRLHRQHDRQQTLPKVVSQLHYPHVTLPRHISTSTKHMTSDEKETLEKLFKLDGLMTTTRDKLRAVIDTQQH